MAWQVRDDAAQQRYEIVDGAQTGATVRYVLHGTVADFVHTAAEPGYEGEGLASELVRGALDDARRRGWQVRPYCPFVRSYLVKHAEYRDLVPSAELAVFGLD